MFTDIERTLIHTHAELDKAEDVVAKSFPKLREDIAPCGLDFIQKALEKLPFTAQYVDDSIKEGHSGEEDVKQVEERPWIFEIETFSG